jgi:hypothetical protein
LNTSNVPSTRNVVDHDAFRSRALCGGLIAPPDALRTRTVVAVLAMVLDGPL